VALMLFHSIGASEMTQNQAVDPLPQEALEDLHAIEKQMRDLQEKLKKLPEWRASLAVDLIESTLDGYRFGLFDVSCIPYKPKNFKHWSDVDPRSRAI
jgi:hypothetical protein